MIVVFGVYNEMSARNTAVPDCDFAKFDTPKEVSDVKEIMYCPHICVFKVKK
jgi:hypothetical protein